ncbi:sensor domain-containing diguanylate cyclase [Nocardia cyriacigeorgica]|uniref:Diguanylate cyclase n=1 Tax=Nocardia cyriacigeorgica TaxID=135487 RepID=A0A5R8N9N6_9NOCA|nr:sensor domain-containing diguanylate cyclase [Nocardia cyriacigeorgica]TLF72414.1 diguanylate cyclase [Nocardia cyriacigeorgica]
MTVAASDIATEWAARLIDSASPSRPSDDAVVALEQWVHRLLVALSGPRWDSTIGERAGAALVDLGFSDPAAISVSVPTLLRLGERAGADAARTATMIGDLAQGFARATIATRQPASEGFETAFRHASVAIAIGDTEGRIIDANPAFENLTGHTLADLRGRSGFDFAPSEQAAIQQRVHDELARSDTGTIRLEGQIQRPDGSHAWVAWTVTRCLSASGEPYLLGFGEDVTDYHTTTTHLQWQAHHDPLTMLANRRHLIDRCQTLIDEAGTGDVAAVCAMDIDDFKTINDTYGHTVGDNLLVAVAARLQACIDRDTDVLARYGGDEFIALLAPPTDQQHTHSIVERLHAAMAKPFDIDRIRLQTSLSIGAFIAPIGDHRVTELLAAADDCLYAAKALGKNQWVLHTAASIETAD